MDSDYNRLNVSPQIKFGHIQYKTKQNCISAPYLQRIRSSTLHQDHVIYPQNEIASPHHTYNGSGHQHYTKTTSFIPKMKLHREHIFCFKKCWRKKNVLPKFWLLKGDNLVCDLHLPTLFSAHASTFSVTEIQTNIQLSPPPPNKKTTSQTTNTHKQQNNKQNRNKRSYVSHNLQLDNTRQRQQTYHVASRHEN